MRAGFFYISRTLYTVYVSVSSRLDLMRSSLLWLERLTANACEVTTVLGSISASSDTLEWWQRSAE
jgi:hypothetical protein